MQDKIETLLNASPITGLAVAVIKDNKTEIICSGEFEGNPVSAHTSWPVASLTKPLFVYAVLQMIQQGLLELDKPLASYLPQPYLNNVEHLSQISARHAMSHTTGFPNWRDADGLRAAFLPGTRYSYSSEGLNYLQHVIEHLIGTSLAEHLHQTVFPELGMRHSVLRPETEATLPPFLSFLLNTMPANSAFSLWTTVEDYARFMTTMLDSVNDWPGQMLVPQIRVGDYSGLYWGLGWGLQKQADTLSFWHWGARGTPRTMNFAVGSPEEQQAIVIFTNHADGLYLCRDIIQNVFPGKTLPAFDWLLPAQQWRPDGSKPDQPTDG